MRHQRRNNKLGRTSSHRKAMMSNLATALILHKRITTTLAKAKELKKYVEPVITRSKEDSTHNRRLCFTMLSDKKAVAELFREISPKIADRPGGYTRILKTTNRPGDNAEMCIIELVDYNQAMLSAKEDKAGKTTRRKRATKKKGETAKTETAPKAIKAENAKESPAADIETSATETIETKASTTPDTDAGKDAEAPEEDNSTEEKK